MILLCQFREITGILVFLVFSGISGFNKTDKMVLIWEPFLRKVTVLTRKVVIFRVLLIISVISEKAVLLRVLITDFT